MILGLNQLSLVVIFYFLSRNEITVIQLRSPCLIVTWLPCQLVTWFSQNLLLCPLDIAETNIVPWSFGHRFSNSILVGPVVVTAFQIIQHFHFQDLLRILPTAYRTILHVSSFQISHLQKYCMMMMMVIVMPNKCCNSLLYWQLCYCVSEVCKQTLTLDGDAVMMIQKIAVAKVPYQIYIMAQTKAKNR